MELVNCLNVTFNEEIDNIAALEESDTQRFPLPNGFRSLEQNWSDLNVFTEARSRFYCNCVRCSNMVTDDLFVVGTSHIQQVNMLTHHKIHFWSSWAQQLCLLTSEAVSHRCVREVSQ